MSLRAVTDELEQQAEYLRSCSREWGRTRNERLGRLHVRDRLASLLDPGAPVFELGLWAGWKMYDDPWGETPAAGVVSVIGRVHGRPVAVVAHDSAVKAGAMFPQGVKKMLRAQRIAGAFRLPILYLVDSAGAFLPLQDEVFPDEDDFGRIFRNNAVLSASGIPQYAAVMGNCIAGGAYLPVLCDKVLMTEGSQMCLAGASLVKAAIGQDVDPETLGGAKMHAEISGTVDFWEPNDEACLRRLRSLVELLADSRTTTDPPDAGFATEQPVETVYDLVSPEGNKEYDVRDLLRAVVDAGSLQEFKAEYGPTLVTALAKIGGRPVGIVANQRQRTMTAKHQLQIGGVIYADSVSKAARFVMDCNQTGVPLVFFQDVQGFMVGVESEQAGIIRNGAKLVSAVSNSVVPKLTVVVGGSFGAGNYAMCGKAYDPALILAWPGSRYAVMGAAQASGTLADLKIRDAQRRGQELSEHEQQALRQQVTERYQETTDIRYGAARGWVDAIIPPHETRLWLAEALRLIPQDQPRGAFRTGVFQV